jgi:hypothetical protein
MDPWKEDPWKEDPWKADPWKEDLWKADLPQAIHDHPEDPPPSYRTALDEPVPSELLTDDKKACPSLDVWLSALAKAFEDDKTKISVLEQLKSLVSTAAALHASFDDISKILPNLDMRRDLQVEWEDIRKVRPVTPRD